MSGSLLSAVLILPDAHKEAGDLTSAAMGHADPGAITYGVSLSPTGQDPATHCGCQSWVEQPFLDAIEAAKGGTLPEGPDWDAVGLTEVDVLAMAGALIVDTKPDGEHEGHFDGVIAELDLQKIAPAFEM